jgi:hypothetical protein
MLIDPERLRRQVDTIAPGASLLTWLHADLAILISHGEASPAQKGRRQNEQATASGRAFSSLERPFVMTWTALQASAE